MSTVTYNYYMAELPWTPSRKDERRYRVILLWIILVFLVSGIVMPLLPVREKPKEKAVELPPRLARIIEERKKPAPKPAKKVERIESKDKPKTKKKAKPKPEKVKPQKKPVDTQVARKKAQSSGLLAFSDELIALRESPSLGSLSNKTLNKGGRTTRKTTRSMVTAHAGKGSAGINTAALSRDTGGSDLGARTTTRVRESVDMNGAGNGLKKGHGQGQAATRDLEQIQITFDRNKGRIYAIYNRALRKDPSLQGKVVLKITISPSGKVTTCEIVSSELEAPKLERKLVQRVKMINFGAANVAPFTFSYPIDFFPA